MRVLWWFLIVVVLCGATSSADDEPWWKTALFYQIYPRSFMDSDGDGVGDLKGITQMADYFTDLGINAIWLSPIYKSPMADFGYDIADFCSVDPIFGTMDDFDELVATLKEIDVKILMDFVPNHSSDEHEWFQKSLMNDSDYRDFYVWHDPSDYNGTTPLPPNNWISVFSGSAWEWSEERQQFYLHQFVVKQPDLNYRDENVISNMTYALQFWLDKGVDGFRMDAVQHIYENSSFPNDPVYNGTDGSTYDDLDHIYEKNQPETIVLLKYWAQYLYEQVLKDSKQRCIFLEVYDSTTVVMEYYGTGNESLEFPFNFALLSNGAQSTRPADIQGYVMDWIDSLPTGGISNWVVGNHDKERVSDRYGYEMVDAINLLTGVLPGIKVTYNGEEIGMRDTFIRWDQTVDPEGILEGESGYQSSSRDPERTPMQWNSSDSAGFSTNSTPWLPVNPNYYWLNVAAQKAADSSHLKVFQAMAKARQDPVLMYGTLDVEVPNNDTLLVIRSYNDSSFALIMNMGSEVLNYTSKSLFSLYSLDIDMTTVAASINTGYASGTNFQNGSISISLRVPSCSSPVPPLPRISSVLSP